MARSFDAATLALLDGPALVDRDLAVIAMPEGTYGFWSDVYSAQFPGYWPGVTFTGSGSLISITPVIQSVADGVQSLTATLSGLASDVLVTIGEYNLHRAKVQVSRALYDPGSRQLVAVHTVFRGYVDRDEMRESGGEATFVLECVSRARELDRATNRKRTHADQQRTYGGDQGFAFTTKTASTKLVMGR